MAFDMSMFNQYLQRKYDILQQQADTQRLGVQADANLANTRAGLLPAESRAGIGLTNAQAAEAGARGRNYDVQTQLAPDLARSSIGLNSANAFESRARGLNLNADTARINRAGDYGFSTDTIFGTGYGSNLASRLGLSTPDFYRLR